MSARFEATSMELGGNLYILNQRAGVYTPDELREIAFADIRKDGGDPKAVILQKIWKYFAQYKREAIEDGLLARLRGMQGEQRTFYTGATFSHEAVSKITAFNTQLARQIARRVRDDQTART